MDDISGREVCAVYRSTRLRRGCQGELAKEAGFEGLIAFQIDKRFFFM